MPQLLGCHSPRFEQCKPAEWRFSIVRVQGESLSDGIFQDLSVQKPRKVRRNRRNAPNMRSILDVFLERNITNAFLTEFQQLVGILSVHIVGLNKKKQAGHVKVIL